MKNMLFLLQQPMLFCRLLLSRLQGLHRTGLVVLLMSLLGACGTEPRIAESSDPSRYAIKNDAPPDEMVPDIENIADAVPQKEPVTKAGNKSPYKVFGKVYYVLPDASGYSATGKASWYGKKFHGHKTANGETYDMFAMTAAHKTLPIPSYVRVTNQANGRSAIVRVNDRGPFHDERVIDLSFAAASKLGYVNTGTADVKVEAIDVDSWLASQKAQPQPAAAPAAAQPGDTWLQVGAYSQIDLAQTVYRRLFDRVDFPVHIESGRDSFHRIRIGPVAEDQVAALADALEQDGFPRPVRVSGPQAFCGQYC